MRKKDKAEVKEKDPLHKEYGIMRNVAFVLKKTVQYRAFLIPLMIVGIFTNSLMQYMWSFIGKYVIDIVDAQSASGNKDIAPLIQLLIVTTVIEVVSMIANSIGDNKRWYNWIYVRCSVLTELNYKVLSMNYGTLENPKMLDRVEKARGATSGNYVGFEGVLRQGYDICVKLAVIAVTLTSVVILDWRLLLVIAVIAGIQFLFFRHTVKKDKKEVWDKLAPVWRRISYMERTTQDFDFAKDIRLFGMRNALSKKQHDILSEKQKRIVFGKNLWIKNSVFSNAMMVISNAAIYGILIYSAVGPEHMSIGDFTLYLGLAGTFSGALTNFLNSIGDLKRYSMETDDLRSYMDIDTEEKGDFLPVPKAKEYVFEFKNVSYKYEGADGYALKKLNLTLKAGQKLAVVGLNGAGKTTFIKLLLRLYDPTEGEIFLNGTNIKRFRREEYYKLFSPVFQNVELFAFPMCENVSMKKPEDTDKAKAEECLIKAGMGEKVKSLSKGVDTEMLKIIHDDGVDLSGGEKQKLALSRALYKNAPVIVLDEPTAALDALAEYELYKSFDDIIGGKSAVYISHRLSSTRFCDEIAMFKAGELVEYGTHDELLAKGGAYAEMFEIQAQYYKEGKDYAEEPVTE